MKIKKETLTIRKEAFEIMLKIKPFEFTGLCSAAKWTLDRNHRKAFMTVLKNYASSNGFNPKSDYCWRKNDWPPRQRWMRRELDKINKKLEAYDVHD